MEAFRYKGRKHRAAIRRLYKESFTRKERTPLSFLLFRRLSKYVDMLVFFENGVFIGFAYLVVGFGNVFIHYLAIDYEYRSKGYGSKALDIIKARYKGFTISLFNADDGNRERRDCFYRKNGFIPFDLRYTERIEYQLMCFGALDIPSLDKLIKRFSFGIVSIKARQKPTILASTHL